MKDESQLLFLLFTGYFYGQKLVIETKLLAYLSFSIKFLLPKREDEINYEIEFNGVNLMMRHSFIQPYKTKHFWLQPSTDL
jgi:hypothetical protein